MIHPPKSQNNAKKQLQKVRFYDIIMLNQIKLIKETTMLKIKFKYRDELSNWEWRNQECIMSSVEECKKVYGLGIDCEYEILSVEEC